METIKSAIVWLVNKSITTGFLTKVYNKAKAFVNLIRIPSLLSFFILKDETINPTLDQTLAEAPPANNNWDRLGLDKEVFLGMPR